MRDNKRPKLQGLYPIIDLDVIQLPLESITDILNQSSVELVQFRSKRADKISFIQNALKFKKLLHPNKLLIINDHIDIALDIANGVHLGQDDYPLERVRKLLPDHFLFGATCHNVTEAKRAESAGASYISIGCLFPTDSKVDTKPTSLKELAEIQRRIRLPLCVIGGINLNNLDNLLSYKVDMVAVISSIWREVNPGLAIEMMQQKILFTTKRHDL